MWSLCGTPIRVTCCCYTCGYLWAKGMTLIFFRPSPIRVVPGRVPYEHTLLVWYVHTYRTYLVPVPNVGTLCTYDTYVLQHKQQLFVFIDICSLRIILGVLCTLFFLSLFFFSMTFIIFALLFSIPPSRNSDPGSHSRLFCPPYPLRFVPCIFYREKISALSSLVDSRRMWLPTLGALSSWSFFIFANKFKILPHGGIRTHGQTLVLIVAFEGYH